MGSFMTALAVLEPDDNNDKVVSLTYPTIKPLSFSEAKLVETLAGGTIENGYADASIDWNMKPRQYTWRTVTQAQQEAAQALLGEGLAELLQDSDKPSERWYTITQLCYAAIQSMNKQSGSN